MGLMLPIAAACGGVAATSTALATFEQFQDALFAGDADAVRGLVTAESTPAVAAMPWQRLRERRRLRAVDAIDCRGCFHIRVLDPNEHDAPGTFVVVREHGRCVVDLVATAGLAVRPLDPATAAALPPLEPRELTPADFDEIHRRELATPPGEPVR